MREVQSALEAHASAHPDRPAVIDGSGTVSYRELAQWVRALVPWAAGLPATVGVAGGKSAATIALDLALGLAGRTLVPLPDFFSPDQLAHVVADAGIEAVAAEPGREDFAATLGRPVVTPCPTVTQCPTFTQSPGDAGANPPPPPGRRIIYTSGTTGRPKGVMLGDGQLAASIAALAKAVGATPADRMLSVLPYALLLEQVAGIGVPLLAGAGIALCCAMGELPRAAATLAPTATVLVPEMLAAWVAWLEQSGQPVPPALRFIAVGGAPVPPGLAERAWALGLPVHEGYGLSECCSVVAVNRPGERAAGTVGRPLPGVRVTIDRGEIVVSGPTVMDGYGGGAAAGGIWRTGDAGRFDAQGRLIVEGRLDDVIVTSQGRNIHPEWIESMLLADRRILRCAVVPGGSHPRAVVVPAAAGPWTDDPDTVVGGLCAEAPDYARPRNSIVMWEADLVRHGLITSSGRLRRRAIRNHLGEM